MKLERYAPVGRNYKQDFKWYGSLLTLAILYTTGFFWELSETLQYLEQGRYQMMPYFAEVVDGFFPGFPLLALACLVYLYFYRQMHYGSSQSHYLMRRLPAGGEFTRRCITLPLATAVLTLVIGLSILLLYFAIYCHLTPEEAYQPGQLWILLYSWLGYDPQYMVFMAPTATNAAMSVVM